MSHIPVLLHEVVAGLQVHPQRHFLDGTVGSGGHAAAMLRASSPNGLLCGCDRDAQALARAKETLHAFGERFLPVHDSYANIVNFPAILARITPLSGILLDLGLSSMQLADPQRGFSLQQDGPLDMRFDRRQQQQASAILRSWPEEELRQIFVTYGEERFAARIADAIVRTRKQRPLRTTQDLVQLIITTVPRTRTRTRTRIHPATRVFQALRIAVNNELDELARFLPIALSILAPKGRLVVIAYHSLEDRIVKQFFRRAAATCTCPQEILVCQCAGTPQARLITRKPLRPQQEEIAENPRCRSAKLRILEKI